MKQTRRNLLKTIVAAPLVAAGVKAAAPKTRGVNGLIPTRHVDGPGRMRRWHWGGWDVIASYDPGWDRTRIYVSKECPSGERLYHSVTANGDHIGNQPKLDEMARIAERMITTSSGRRYKPVGTPG